MLILPIKKKWFDMILSGEKKEEYREIKSYYESRFANVFGEEYLSENADKCPVKEVVFRNGYSSDSSSFTANCRLKKGTGKPEWGAEEGKEYYILEICDVNQRLPIP